MKTKVLLLLMVIGCMIVVSSCRNNTTAESQPTYGEFLESIVAKQYSSADSTSISVGHRIEISIESAYCDELVDPNIIVNVSEAEYNLKYQGSTTGALYQDTVHIYSTYGMIQYINADTKKCVICSFPKTDNNGKVCSEDELKEIANDFVIQAVEDPESYLITYYKYSESGSLFVYYTRMAGDIETYDQIRLSIRKNGDISLYNMEHTGNLKGVQPIPSSVIEKARVELERRGNDIYGLLGDGYSYTLSTEIDRLVRLDDGSLALDCHVDADITTPEGTKLSDGAWFIIPITEPTQ